MEKLKISMLDGIAVFISVLAGLDWFLVYLFIIFMAIDLITGWYKSTKNGNYSSKIMKEGLKGKVVELLIVFALLFLQKAFESFGILLFASNFILFGFALKEFMSIMENWCEAGHKIPDFIKNWLTIAQGNFEEQVQDVSNISSVKKEK